MWQFEKSILLKLGCLEICKLEVRRSLKFSNFQIFKFSNFDIINFQIAICLMQKFLQGL